MTVTSCGAKVSKMRTACGTPLPTECGQRTWKAASTTTLPRRFARVRGRSVLNQLCTDSSGAALEHAWFVVVVMVNATPCRPQSARTDVRGYFEGRPYGLLCAESTLGIQEGCARAGARAANKE